MAQTGQFDFILEDYDMHRGGVWIGTYTKLVLTIGFEDNVWSVDGVEIWGCKWQSSIFGGGKRLSEFKAIETLRSDEPEFREIVAHLDDGDNKRLIDARLTDILAGVDDNYTRLAA
jgi:hypothetical protein